MSPFRPPCHHHHRHSALDPPTPQGRTSVLETFHGPTAAFKDIGMQMTVRLLGYFLNQKGRNANVLTETSGDTGPAALAACAGVPGIEIFCLYPKGRVSRVQELQLTTAEGDAPNIHVFRTDGNTDEQAEVLKSGPLQQCNYTLSKLSQRNRTTLHSLE